MTPDIDSVELTEEQSRQMRKLVSNLLDPEIYGYAVTAEVRDAARVVLGMQPVETITRRTTEPT